jgi:mannosyltransferase
MENSNETNASLRWRSMAFYTAIVLTVLAALIRFTNLGRESLWFDEAGSVGYANLSWQMLWRPISTSETNSALYYLLLHWYVRLGQSEFAVRSLSAVLGLLTVPVIYALGKRMFDTRVALIGAFLLAANTFHVRYSQEARAYSLVVLLITLSSLFFVRAVERRSRSDWAWYVITSVLAVYSHVFALLVLCAQWGSLIVLSRRKVSWRQFLMSVALIILLSVPLGICLLRDGAGHLAWISPTTLSDVRRLFASFAGGTRFLTTTYFVSCLAAFVFTVRAWRNPKSDFEAWHYSLLVSWLFLPVLIAFAASLRHPVFLDRYLIVILPSFVLLAAVGLSRIYPRWILAGVLVVVAVAMGRSLISYNSTMVKENWRGATSYVLSQSSPLDGMIFYTWPGRIAFDYYVGLEGHAGAVGKVVYPEPFDWSNNPEPEISSYGQLGGRYRRIWLIETHLGDAAREQKSLSLQAYLASQYPNVSKQNFRGVDILLYSKDKHTQVGQ